MDIGTSKSTRYNLELTQFSSVSSKGDIAGMIQSIAGNQVYTFSTYA